jgi:hypothetical protein
MSDEIIRKIEEPVQARHEFERNGGLSAHFARASWPGYWFLGGTAVG